MTTLNRPSVGVSIAAIAIGCLAWSSPRVMGEPASQLTATTVDRSLDPMHEVTPERAAAAETFAQLHHPDLAELLTRLKAARHADYDNAIRELFRESERLAKVKARDASRYELELAAWKTASRIQLATARLAMEDSSELIEELRVLLQARIDARVDLLQLERDRLQHRLQKHEADLRELQAEPAVQVEQDLEKLLKSARSRANQAAKKSAANRKLSGRETGAEKLSETATTRPVTPPQRGSATLPAAAKP